MLLSTNSFAPGLMVIFVTAAFGGIPAVAQLPGPDAMTAVSGGTMIRKTGLPTKDALRFPGWVAEGELVVYNGGRAGAGERVRAARVWLNGSPVATPSDFRKRSAILRFRVEAELENILEWEILGMPGAQLDYEIRLAIPDDLIIEDPETLIDIITADEFGSELHAWLSGYGFSLVTGTTSVSQTVDPESLELAGSLEESAGTAVHLAQRVDAVRLGRPSVIALYANALGVTAVLVSNAEWPFPTMQPFVAIKDDASTLVFNAVTGIRFSPDQPASTLNGEQIAAIMSSLDDGRSVDTQARPDSGPGSRPPLVRTDFCEDEIQQQNICLVASLERIDAPSSPVCVGCVMALSELVNIDLTGETPPLELIGDFLMWTALATLNCRLCGVGVGDLRQCLEFPPCFYPGDCAEVEGTCAAGYCRSPAFKPLGAFCGCNSSPFPGSPSVALACNGAGACDRERVCGACASCSSESRGCGRSLLQVRATGGSVVNDAGTTVTSSWTLTFEDRSVDGRLQVDEIVDFSGASVDVTLNDGLEFNFNYSSVVGTPSISAISTASGVTNAFCGSGCWWFGGSGEPQGWLSSRWSYGLVCATDGNPLPRLRTLAPPVVVSPGHHGSFFPE